jgi:hypothetical protein
VLDALSALGLIGQVRALKRELTCPVAPLTAKSLRLFYARFHSIVCLDACFEQLRCKGAGGTDQAIDDLRTCFLSPGFVESVKNEVESIRRRGTGSSHGSCSRPGNDFVEDGLSIPVSVLEGCEKSFLAANENKEKASTSDFSDTGLVACICRHDCVLWLVNMTTAGEKQYYAIALLEALFRELPSWWLVGVLYDIGCQLHRSVAKVSKQF